MAFAQTVLHLTENEGACAASQLLGEKITAKHFLLVAVGRKNIETWPDRKVYNTIT
jgi:hypothetical protein